MRLAAKCQGATRTGATRTVPRGPRHADRAASFWLGIERPARAGGRAAGERRAPGPYGVPKGQQPRGRRRYLLPNRIATVAVNPWSWSSQPFAQPITR